jgi:5-methylthioadenosine/S-adenosylhomocysteine deaminase
VYNLVSHLVYSATGADVRDVIIDGKPVMENRKLLTLDEGQIFEKMQGIKKNILQRIQGKVS